MLRFRKEIAWVLAWAVLGDIARALVVTHDYHRGHVVVAIAMLAVAVLLLTGDDR